MGDLVDDLIEAVTAHGEKVRAFDRTAASQEAAAVSIAAGKLREALNTRVNLVMGEDSETGFGEVEVYRYDQLVFSGVGRGALVHLAVDRQIPHGALVVISDPDCYLTMHAAASLRESIVRQAGHDQFVLVVATAGTAIEVVDPVDLAVLDELAADNGTPAAAPCAAAAAEIRTFRGAFRLS